ncbi:PREDICTED: 39S ribosomal protein L10, mitochondrial [Crocodylus porosus]|uniref:Large ribosomal subunit protein uL10m n=1 Tax=Crocodylus porosus TaxID=8502 RepID=A0A7M4EJ72_CROPO|nr:PREDICTED: 39S ribosomal protein L10, mitochondrial [Crocodylus porosus]
MAVALAVVLCSRGLCRAGAARSQPVRASSKAVTRHWKAMHFERQKLMAVTEYIAPRPLVPPHCITPPIVPVQEENGYAKLLRRQVGEIFRSSKMIAVCQFNSPSNDEMQLVNYHLMKHNIWVKKFPNEIMRAFLSESKYKNLLPLFVGKNILLVSPETKAKEMLRILKRVPEVVLLGACIENTILSRQGVLNYSKLPSLELAQGQVVGTLVLVPSQTCTVLQSNSVYLTALLSQYIKQQNDRSGDTEKKGECPAEPSPAKSSGSP